MDTNFIHGPNGERSPIDQNTGNSHSFDGILQNKLQNDQQNMPTQNEEEADFNDYENFDKSFLVNKKPDLV